MIGESKRTVTPGKKNNAKFDKSITKLDDKQTIINDIDSLE